MSGVMRVAATAGDLARDARFGAGIIAAMSAEAAFILMVTAVTMARGMDPWMPSRMAGALILGPAAVQPPGFVAADVAVGLGLHAGMAVLVGALYAALLPRVGVSPVTGGIIAGMLLYVSGFWILPCCSRPGSHRSGCHRSRSCCRGSRTSRTVLCSGGRTAG